MKRGAVATDHGKETSEIQTERKTGGTLCPKAKCNLIKATGRREERGEVLYVTNGSPSSI